MSGRRYTAAVMRRARELRGAGWSLRKIAELIERETGVRPAPNTVSIWCFSEKQKEARRTRQNRSSARWRAESSKPTRYRTAEWKLARIRGLYLRGVSLRAIGQVAAIWWGEELTGAQVRSRLGLASGEVIAARQAERAASAQVRRATAPGPDTRRYP